MKIKIDGFKYWVEERHRIYKKKENGKPKPWTDNKVLQRYFFTNPFRENDKTTKWFAEYIREPLANKTAVILATIIFRWFNLPRTGMLLLGSPISRVPEASWCEHSTTVSKLSGSMKNWRSSCLIKKWDEKRAITGLRKLNETGPVFTSAFMIKIESGPLGSKIPSVCKAITAVWRDRQALADDLEACTTLEDAHKRLIKYRGLGNFMAYEIVCDLYHTYILKDATDKMTWANMGPGAARGMNRLLGRDPSEKLCQSDWVLYAQSVLKDCRKILSRSVPRDEMDMRFVEHSLCEYDKYERAIQITSGDNPGIKMKRRYEGI